MTPTAAPIASEFQQRYADAKQRINAAGLAYKRREAERLAKIERMRTWVPEPTETPLAQHVRKALDGKQLLPRSAIKRIQLATCREFNCSHVDLLSGRRAVPIMLARHVGVWLSRKLTTGSYPQIAKAFKRVDHTSVIHAIKATDRRMAADPKLRDKVLALEATLAREVGVEC